MAFSRLVPLALLVSLAACTGEVMGPLEPMGQPGPAGGAGGGEGGGSVVPVPPDCSAGPGETPLRRLSTQQYQNTVRDLLAQSGVPELTATVQPLLDAVPADSTLAFTGLDNRLSGQHLSAWFDVAVAVGDALERSAAQRTAVAGACANAPTLSTACVDGFFAGFGRRALRRPLSPAEQTSLRALNDGVRPPAEVLRAMVVSLLLAPGFLNRLEIDGVPTASGPLALNAFELASRLSYTFWQTLPDDALLDAAASGALLTEAGYAQQLQRVFDDPRTRRTLWVFWREWLKLDAFSGFATTRPGFRAFAAGQQFGEAGHDHYGDMVQEVKLLTEHFTFEQPGPLEGLLSTDLSLTRSSDLARLYGVPAYSGTGAPPRFTDGSRAGLLQRAALLVNNTEQTNPFHRGALLRRTLLCDPLPQPDPNALPPGSLDPPVSSATDTTRERYAKKIDGNNLCVGCHSVFSDLGYVQESYDAIGRFRTVERAFDEQTGALLAQLPIDTTGVPRVRGDDARPVSGPAELNQRVIESGKVASCLSRNYLRFSLRRELTTGGDACVQERLAQRLRGPSTLAEVFRAIAEDPSFRLKTLGAP